MNLLITGVKEIGSNFVDIFYGNTNYYKNDKINFFQESDINKILRTNSLSHQTMYFQKKYF